MKTSLTALIIVFYIVSNSPCSGDRRAGSAAGAAPPGQQADRAAALPGQPRLPELQVHPQAGQQPLGAAHRGPAHARRVPRHRVHQDR